jgi:hypothetical protein
MIEVPNDDSRDTRLKARWVEPVADRSKDAKFGFVSDKEKK